MGQKCEFCDREVYAKGLCNAHYLRKRLGRNMLQPIREKGGPCLICGGPNYGLQACKKHYHKVRAWLIKSSLVQLLGGKCMKCADTFPVPAFDFHHRDPSTKMFAIGNSFNDRGYAELVEEVKKCDLLCANCHRIHHSGEEEWKCQTLTSQFQLYLGEKADTLGMPQTPEERQTSESASAATQI